MIGRDELKGASSPTVIFFFLGKTRVQLRPHGGKGQGPPIRRPSLSPKLGNRHDWLGIGVR